MKMPSSRLLTVVAIVGALASISPSVSAAEDSITFYGGGWGHGVGMSQYGAYGQALEGRTAEQILTHYYPGTAVVPSSTITTHPDPIWVGLLQDQTFVDFIMHGDNAALCLNGDGLGDCPALGQPQPEGRLAGAGERWRFYSLGDGQCRFAKEAPAGSGVYVMMGPDAGTCTASITWAQDPDTRPHDVSMAHIELPNQSRSYARGVLRFRPAPGGKFHEVLTIPLEQYLYGIHESLNHWPHEALKAQAIAARSYAISRVNTYDPISTARQTQCWCHLFDDTRDQFFEGWAQETVDAWRAAVDDSTGLVVGYEGSIATTFYSSSSYGATEPVELVFGGPPVTYLRSVPDPWSADPAINPKAIWAGDDVRSVPLTTLATTLGMVSVTSAVISDRSPSGAAAMITFYGDGPPVTKTAWWLRQRLGLLSPQITRIVTPNVSGPDNVGLHDPTTGIWTLRISTGDDISFYYGNPADIPYAGDWDGNGSSTLGLYRQSTGFLFLRNSNTQGVADINIYYGNPGDLPVAGDWNGDGTDTVGIFRPSEATVYLRNTNTQGIGDISYPFGISGDQPIAGDWDGDGLDTVALWRPSTNEVFFDNDLDGVPETTFIYSGALSGDRIIAGDWDEDGIDTIGVYRLSDRTFYLRDKLDADPANVVVEIAGAADHMSPVAGSWGL